MKRYILLPLVVVMSMLGLAKGDEPSQPKLQLHVVPVPVKSCRLLAMSRDDDGGIWAGSTHRVVHRYDPRTGAVENVTLPYPATVSACLCAGKKVYILGQAYPRLIIYDRSSKKFSEVAYPSAKPDVWYGTQAGDGRYLYLFDRAGAGVVKWDTQAETGKVIAWPYQTPFPASGRYEPRDQALWCNVWDFAKGQYQPLGIARLDLAKDEFSGWHPFPDSDADLKQYADPAATFFLPATLRGRVVPFDFKEKRWCRFLAVPQYGKLFGFLGGPVPHQGRYYFSLSTYNGTEVGCDGKPYHFNNALLAFDPQTRNFEFLTLEAKDAYHQVAYMLSAGGEFYATGVNIREPDGKLNLGRVGEVVFWQTQRPARK